MEQKIVFFDIDGTLYDRGNPIGVPDSTREAVKRLQANGHLAFICTGRTYAELEDWLRDFGFDGMICGCGTYISYKGETLHYRELDQALIEKLVQISEEYKTMPILEGQDYVYFDDCSFRGKSSRLSRIYDHCLEDFKGHVKPLHGEKLDNVQKLTIRFEDDHEPKLQEMFAKLQENIALINHGFAVECVPMGYNKASGIERLINALHIDRKNTYAFGDSVNDTEMLSYVEYGIAMGNSVPEILALANYRTDALYEDGIYKACERFGLI